MATEFTMRSFSSFAGLIVGLVKAIKSANPDTFSINTIKRAPLILIFSEAYAFCSGCVVGLKRFILSILCVRCDSQIRESVVAPISIDVINVSSRITSMNDGPDNAVSKKSSPVKGDKPITVSLRKFCKLSNLSAGARYFASQTADLFVVRKELTKIVDWKGFWASGHEQFIHESSLFCNVKAN